MIMPSLVSKYLDFILFGHFVMLDGVKSPVISSFTVAHTFLSERTKEITAEDMEKVIRLKSCLIYIIIKC